MSATGPVRTHDERTGANAPRGSPEWIYHRRAILRAAIGHMRVQYSSAELMLLEVEKVGGWQHLGLHSFEEFCADRSKGLGVPLPQLRSQLADAKRLAGDTGVAPLAQHGGPRTVARKEQGNNVTLPVRGNTAAYRVAKLKRDRPDIAARLAAGEFGSVRAAERAAGVVPSKIEQAFATAKSAYRQLDAEHRKAFHAWVQADLRTPPRGAT